MSPDAEPPVETPAETPAETPSPEPVQSMGTALKAMIQALGQSLGLEVRHLVSALVFRAVAIVLLLVGAAILMIAGLLRLVGALSTTCGVWLGNPILGEVTAGVALLVIAALGVWMAWRRVRH